MDSTNRVCEVCSSRPAKLVVLRRRLDDLHRTFVCAECAGERTGLYGASGLDLERLVARMDRTTPNQGPAYGCKMCGTTLADIIADGKPGCCACYSRFASEIDQAIGAAQQRRNHVGKAPR